VRARIGNGAKRGAANIWNIGKPSDKASDDSGRNPLRAGAVLARGFTFGSSSGSEAEPGYIRCVAKTVTAQRVFHYVTGSK
jgi:hypothetical protein